MVKRKKLKIDPPLARLISTVALSFIVGILLVSSLFFLLAKSDYFKVKAVMVDPQLYFISKSDVPDVIGKSVFSIDLAKVHRRILKRYPQISQLNVVREFPDKIAIQAVKRFPFAQAKVNNGPIIFDDHGVVISTTSKLNEHLPTISGLMTENRKFSLGQAVRGNDILAALQIIKLFGEEQSLSSYQLASVNVENLSKVDLILTNQLNVIVDKDRLDEKIKMLGLVLSQAAFDLKEVKYIDLRFKEPILGKK